jgi:hypothetical protein
MSSWKDVHKGVGNGSELAGVEAVFHDFAGCRNLMECLTGYVPGEKGILTPCRVTLFYEFGHVKLCINDKITERLGFVSLTGDSGSLEAAIEGALSSAIDWRKAAKPAAGGFQGRR